MENEILNLWNNRKPVLNSWMSSSSPFCAEVLAESGYDSITVDLQHGLNDYKDALSIFQAIGRYPVVPMVRVPWLDPQIIMKTMDAGAMGVICPMINNRKEAEKFVQACMYPPDGFRSFGPMRGFLYGGSDYPKYANEEVLKFAMIETKEALEKLDEIMTTPGLSGVYIGPADLSIALGEEPGFDKSENTKAYSEICRILEFAKKNNIFSAIHNGTPEYALKMIEKGFNLVTVGSDHRSIITGAKEIVDKIKGSLKKSDNKTY